MSDTKPHLTLSLSKEEALALFEACRSLDNGGISLAASEDNTFGPSYSLDSKRAHQAQAILIKWLPELAKSVGSRLSNRLNGNGKVWLNPGL